MTEKKERKPRKPREPASKRVYRISDVMNVVGLRRTAIAERVRAGDFPQPIVLGPRSKGWLVEEVNEWLAERAARRAGSRTPAESATG